MAIVRQEVSVSDFDFWSGALYWINRLTEEERDKLDAYLDDMEFESPTELNDFIWFNTEIWMEWLGINEDEVNERNPWGN